MANTINEKLACPPIESLELLLNDTTKIEKDVITHVDSCLVCQSQLDLLTDSAKLKSYSATARSKYRLSTDPTSIEHFTINSRLGSGGNGTVYRAWDGKLDRQVAIKVLNPITSETVATRFEREAKAASKLSHPNIVPVYSSGKAEDGRPFLVMPLIEGPTLKQAVVDKSLSFMDIATIIRQLAAGLAVAHDQGLVHRDVKPANSLLDQNDHQAKLVDFGLVRGIDDETLTRSELLCGTPEYMAPEYANTESSADKLQDIYSLGISLYECLTGTVPFQGKPLDVLSQHRDQDPIPPSRTNRSIPRDLEVICLKALEKEPSRRYQSASLMANDLKNFLDDKPILAKPTSNLEKSIRWIKRNRALAFSLFSLFVVLLASSIVSTILWRNSAENAKLAEDRNRSLNSSLNLLKQNQQQLGQTLRSTYLGKYRTADFMNLSIEVRNTILIELVKTWRLLFERSQDDIDELISMATELLDVSEFTLENGLATRSLEVTDLNEEIVDRIVQLGPERVDCLILAAEAYNFRADSLLFNRKPSEMVLERASALSKQAMQLTKLRASASDFQLALIQSIESERLKIKSSLFEKSRKEELLEDLLSKVENANKNQNNQLHWWKLEQQLTSDASKVALPTKAIAYHNRRDEILRFIVNWHVDRELASMWLTRKQAVNRVFLGVKQQAIGNMEEAVSNWDFAEKAISNLITNNPLNPQFRADLTELSLIQANHDWQEHDKDSAIKSLEKVLKDLNDTIQVAPNDHQLLNRGAQICQLIGSRYLESSDPQKAAEIFRKGAEYSQSAFVLRRATLGADPKPDKDFAIGLFKQAADAFKTAELPELQADVLKRLNELIAEPLTTVRQQF